MVVIQMSRFRPIGWRSSREQRVVRSNSNSVLLLCGRTNLSWTTRHAGHLTQPRSIGAGAKKTCRIGSGMSPFDERDAALLELALEKPAGKRPAFLDAICEGDPDLRARLEALLAAHGRAGAQLTTDFEEDVPTGSVTVRHDRPDEAEGHTFGRYKLLEKLGEGGFGAVWLAAQKEPVRRKVALKIIKLGMDTRQVVARFEAERQALAMMDHPNIAKVLDAGTTDAGRPYFVMELVRGIRITDYCDQVRLSNKERLDLFIKVCQAIQHAHQKGIIHRDIKPSNILVTLHDGVPVPKVI